MILDSNNLVFKVWLTMETYQSHIPQDLALGFYRREAYVRHVKMPFSLTLNMKLEKKKKLLKVERETERMNLRILFVD